MPNIYMFTAPCCGKEFKKKGKLWARHLAAKGAMCLICTLCNAGPFPQKQNLVNHCKVCPKKQDPLAAILHRLTTLEKQVSTLQRKNRELVNFVRRQGHQIEEGDRRLHELKCAHKATAKNLGYFGYRQVAIEQHFDSYPRKEQMMLDRYNDLANRVDKRLCMSGPSMQPVFVMPVEGHRPREYKDPKTGELLGDIDDKLRVVCTEINRLRSGAPLSRDEAISFKAQVKHYTCILKRCEYSWPDGVCFIPHIFGQTRHDYWKATSKSPVHTEITKAETAKPRTMPTLVNGDPLFDKHWDLIQLFKEAIRVKNISLLICEFIGCKRGELADAWRALRIDPRCKLDWDDAKNPNQKPWPDRAYDLKHDIRVFCDGQWLRLDIAYVLDDYKKYAGAFKKPKAKGRGRKVRYPDTAVKKNGEYVRPLQWREMKYKEYVAQEKRKYNEAQAFGKILKIWGHL